MRFLAHRARGLDRHVHLRLRKDAGGALADERSDPSCRIGLSRRREDERAVPPEQLDLAHEVLQSPGAEDDTPGLRGIGERCHGRSRPLQRRVAPAPAVPPRQSFDGQRIAGDAETDDDAGTRWREIRVLADRLACVHVRDVHFDDRNRDRLDLAVQGDRRVRVGAGVEDDPCRLRAGAAGLVQPVDENAFVIALPEVERQAVRRRDFAADRLDIGERARAVDARLTRAEQIQIRAVEDVDGGHGAFRRRCSAAAARIRRPGERFMAPVDEEPARRAVP